MDEAFYTNYLANRLNNNLPKAMAKKNEHSLRRMVKAAIKLWRAQNPGVQPTAAQVKQWIKDADAVNFDLAINVYDLKGGHLIPDSAAAVHDEVYEAMNKKVAAATDPIASRLAALELRNQLRDEEMKEVNQKLSQVETSVRTSETNVMAAIAALATQVSSKGGGGGRGRGY